MRQVQQITTDALQQQVLVLPDGSSLSLTLNYLPQQLGWFIQNLTYNDFQLNGVRICNSPNLLYQWKNLIPFGLACYTLPSNREPTLQTDFSEQISILYVLDADEVQEYADILSGKSS